MTKTSLTLAEIEAAADESSQSLQSQTGVTLPRLTLTPPRQARRVEYDPLGIELPLGSLFYPCCGSDTEHAIASFGSYVNDCHFADPYRSPDGRSRRTRDLRELFVPHVETIVSGGRGCRRIDNSPCPVYSHKKDGLLTLIEDISLLSIFYYRGDSYGEGGSNQRWLEPVLFHALLGRLLDGGLIATTGPNCGSGRQERTVPWRALCDGSPSGNAFQYAHRNFRCLGELDGARHEPVRLWQVTALQP